MHTLCYAICYTVVCMIYVALPVIFSSLCRGGGVTLLYFLEWLHIYIANLHIPDPILIVNMLSIAGHLATLN